MKAPAFNKLIGALKVLQGTPLTLGTVCSGTDMPSYILNKICDQWFNRYGIRVQVHHVFSCDSNPVAQSWILRHFTPRILFRDIVEVGSKDAAFDVKTQQAQAVPVVQLAIAGTECDNYSALNFHTRAGAEGVASTGSVKSGSTLEGLLSYIVKCKPRLVVWENSDKAKVADLTHLTNLLWVIGYVVAWQKVDASDFSLQSRPRIYLVAAWSKAVESVAKEKAITDSVKEAILARSWVPKAFQMLRSFRGSSFACLEDISGSAGPCSFPLPSSSLPVPKRSGAEWSGVERSGAGRRGVKRSGTGGAEPSGAERSGAEGSGAERSGVERSRAEQSGVELGGVERSGAEWSGVERRGAGQSGVEQSGAGRSGGKCSGAGLGVEHGEQGVEA